MRGSDFNYKVALASGLKSLQAGQARKAEEQFKYLRDKFPHADGGYRGLAKVASEQGDLPGALVALRDGAAALARAGERAGAIGLLREILTLEPLDHGAHRRLAAALILAGDRPAAAAEYDRYSQLLIQTPGGEPRARLELEYAREQLGSDLGSPFAESVMGPAPVAPSPEPAPSGPPRLEPVRQEAAPAPPPAPAVNHASGDLEQRAVAALAAHDASAAPVILDAARGHIAARRLVAATDLLLQTIAAGIAVHEAERLLVEVATLSGNHALARERAALLSRLAQP